MKKHFIIANWKSYKTAAEVADWLAKVKEFDAGLQNDDVELVVCPPYLFLPQLKSYIDTNNSHLKLGVQDISQFGEGSYTGAIHTKQVKDFVTYAIVGHSERRKYFHESDEDVLTKVKLLLEEQITPVLCISDLKQLHFFIEQGTLLQDNSDKIVFVYEPPGAISGGGAFHPEDPESANNNAGQIQEIIGKEVITLYGGSVNPENAKELFSKTNISGGLVGQASLDPEKFIKLIQSF